MPRVNRGTPQSKQSGSGDTGSKAGAENIVADNRRIWKDRHVGVYSIPNPTEYPAYFCTEVGNLGSADFTLCFDRGVINSSSGIDYPVNHEPQFDAAADPQLAVQRFSDDQRQSGAMFTVPPQSRVHIAVRINKDRKDRLDFPVVLNEHAGPDRTSPVLTDQPAVHSLEWIPAPNADAVEIKLFSAPGKMLIWEAAPEPDWVRFRRWNAEPRTGKFPWTSNLFHHPSCFVRITNNSSLPVWVTPRLIFSRADSKGEATGKPQEETLDTRAELQPGEEIEWPCALSLADAKLPRLEADQLRLTAYAEVAGPANANLGRITAPGTIRGEYIPFPGKIIDWVALIAGTLFAILFLMWLFVGIPIPHNSEIVVQLHYTVSGKSLNRGEVPGGVDPGNLGVKLKSDKSDDAPALERYSKSDNTYHVKLGQRWLPGWRWPGHYISPDTKYKAIVYTGSQYQFKDSEVDFASVDINSSAPQIFEVKCDLGDDAGKLQTFHQSVTMAKSYLADATKLLSQHQSADTMLSLANTSIGEAKTSMDALSASQDKTQIMEQFATVQTQQATVAKQQSSYDAGNQGKDTEQKADETMRSLLASAANAVKSQNSMLAHNTLAAAPAALLNVHDAAVNRQLSDQLTQISQDLDKLDQTQKKPDKVNGGNSGAVPSSGAPLPANLTQDATGSMKRLLEAVANGTEDLPAAAEDLALKAQKISRFYKDHGPVKATEDWANRALAMQGYAYLVHPDEGAPNKSGLIDAAARDGARDPWVNAIQGAEKVQVARQAAPSQRLGLTRTARDQMKQVTDGLSGQDKTLGAFAFYYLSKVDVSEDTANHLESAMQQAHVKFAH